MKNIEEFSGKGSGEWTSRQKKRYNKKSNRTQQKNKTGESKAESNDSPEVPDGGETSDIPGLPSGLVKKQCPPAQVHCTKTRTRSQDHQQRKTPPQTEAAAAPMLQQIRPLPSAAKTTAGDCLQVAHRPSSSSIP